MEHAPTVGTATPEVPNKSTRRIRSYEGVVTWARQPDGAYCAQLGDAAAVVRRSGNLWSFVVYLDGAEYAHGAGYRLLRDARERARDWLQRAA